MAFNVTSNFAGKEAGGYLAASLKEARSLDYLTQINNVRYKSNLQTMAGTSLLVDSTCDFTDAGTLALTEKVLEVKPLQINIDLCKNNLVSSWESLQMSGAYATPPPSFEDYVISYMGGIIAEGVENSVWSGVTATTGEFTGFLGTAVGYLLPGVDATVIQSTASGAYSAANIIANLQTLTADMAANVPAILGKEDLHIYMNNKTYAFYISAVSTLGYVNAYNMNGDYEPVFEGYKIAVCPGMPDNQMVAAQKSNLFWGTNLVDDFGDVGTGVRIGLMDMANLDGSDNMRLVARFSGGVQTGVGADIVRQS
tara:strand:+ start:18699 stop:19631 length:933 start_codon:yes stop_codon:yes gene_type:complete